MSQPTTKIQSLAEALPAEIERCRKLAEAEYARDFRLTAMGIKHAVTRAESALASGDVVAMLRSYQELKDHE